MENEFKEMKTKYKYQKGHFLEDDRKDNEIIILRAENSNLKDNINKLEIEVNEYKIKEKETKKILLSNLKTNINKRKWNLSEKEIRKEIKARVISNNIFNIQKNNIKCINSEKNLKIKRHNTTNSTKSFNLTDSSKIRNNSIKKLKNFCFQKLKVLNRKNTSQILKLNLFLKILNRIHT